MSIVRRIVVGLGLLCVLLHAGTAALHRQSLAAPAGAPAHAAAGERDLAMALAAAMCGRLPSGTAAADGPAPAIPGPASVCLDCCCPAVPVLAEPSLAVMAAPYRLVGASAGFRSEPGVAERASFLRPQVRAPPSLS